MCACIVCLHMCAWLRAIHVDLYTDVAVMFHAVFCLCILCVPSVLVCCHRLLCTCAMFLQCCDSASTVVFKMFGRAICGQVHVLWGLRSVFFFVGVGLCAHECTFAESREFLS